MKKFISISLFISACFLGSCSSYDDERIWQDLNEIEKTIGDYEAQTETLTAQMASLSKVCLLYTSLSIGCHRECRQTLGNSNYISRVQSIDTSRFFSRLS